MFDIGWSELMLIGIVALIVIGPKELPSVLRTVGRTMTKLRRMAGEFQGQFQEALREADIADMRKEISSVTDTARSSMGTLATSDMFDPLRSIREEIRATVEGGAKTAPAGAAPAGEPAGAAGPASQTGAPETPAAQAAIPAPSEPLVPLPPAEPLPDPVFAPRAADPVPARPADAAPFEDKKSAS